MGIMRTPICLVLGAGASKPYELPLGIQLRQEIIGLKGDVLLRRAAGLDEVPNPNIYSSLDKFIDTFRYSGKYSIDAFLARNSEYIRIGKLAIAYTILRHEMFDNLIRHNPSEDWYQYLWNKISDVNWDDFDVSNISIISFNYDRSLEKYLVIAAINTYGKKLSEVRDRLSKMRIVHVYGSLGPAWPWEDGYLEYGADVTSEVISSAAQSIEVIPEAREDSERLTEAKKMLQSARKIAFLGFGFDSLNMQRLNLRETLEIKYLDKSTGWTNREIYFTCLGMYSEEVNGVASKLDPEFMKRPVIGLPEAFYDANSLTLLRKTLFFD